MKTRFHKIARLLTIMLIGMSFALTTTGCSPGPYWKYYYHDNGHHKKHHKKHKPKKYKKYKNNHHDHHDWDDWDDYDD